MWFSSIGMGTYLGPENAATDALYTEAMMEAVKRGCNVFDTAINYRHQRSERAIGQALSFLLANRVVAREELIIATKGGYLPFDGKLPEDPPAYARATYMDTGIVRPDDVIEWNCITPGYIEDQIERSRKNLRLDTIDIYYLHNAETQLLRRSKEEFYALLRDTFEMLERKVEEKKIRMYGLATWNGFRQPAGARDSLSLEQIIKTAESVAGKKHHFMVVQLPHNLVLSEAMMKPTQSLERRLVPFLEAALHYGVTVMTSVPTLQSKLAANLPAEVARQLPGLRTDAQRAIQFARSTTGVTTTLCGMKQKAHVIENMEVAAHPRAGDAALIASLESLAR